MASERARSVSKRHGKEDEVRQRGRKVHCKAAAREGISVSPRPPRSAG